MPLALADGYDLAVWFYDEPAEDLRTRFGHEGPAVRVEQWADELGAASRARYAERNHSSVTVPALLDAWRSLLLS